MVVSNLCGSVVEVLINKRIVRVPVGVSDVSPQVFKLIRERDGISEYKSVKVDKIDKEVKPNGKARVRKKTKGVSKRLRGTEPTDGVQGGE